VGQGTCGQSAPFESPTPTFCGVPSGPVYDNALRQLASGELVGLCRWLGIVADPDTARLSESLPAATQYADLLVSVGPRRLVQVEFERRPRADLPLRLLEYRARIMRRNPGFSLGQHVVVLAGGRVTAELRDGEDFFARTKVTYLREHDPDSLLADLSVAPLASLGRMRRPTDRAAVLRSALQVIATRAAPERVSDLAAVTIVLAGIHLDPDTIERARKEAGMPISLEGTVAGRILRQRAEAEGEARGRVEGEALGRVEGEALGRVEGEAAVLVRLLTNRFGADERAAAVARRLVEQHGESAVDLVLSTMTLDDLVG
jgi:predicted transposase YdaD